MILMKVKTSVLCTLTNKFARTASNVPWSAKSYSSSCFFCGGTTNHQKKEVNANTGMRKPILQLLCSTNLFPKVSSSFVQQSSSISSSCVAKSTTTSAAIADNQSGAQWDLFAGVLVERKPILTNKLDDFQKKYAEYLAQLEFENSKLSDHEVRHKNDLKTLEKVKAGELDLGNIQTAKDDEDRWNAEAQEFQPESRETDADRNNDVRSLERALDSHLLLVVEQKIGQDYRWICPHSKLEQGETLRQAAERMLRVSFPDIKTKILGHAPWGFYKYKYPRAADTTAIGAKVFFYKAQVVSGDAKESRNETIKDFVWLKRDELQSKLQPEYYNKLSECLLDD